MSSPSKSPAASCILDHGFQVESDSENDLERSNSVCSCCLECNNDQSQGTAPVHEAEVRSTSSPNLSSLSGERPELRTEADDQQFSNTHVEASSQTSSDTLSNNSFTIILIPKVPILVSKKWLNCYGYESLTASIGVVALTICEFCPWLFGVVIVYYSYKSWGISSAIGSLFLMVLSQALLRYLKTNDKLEDKLKNKNHLAAQSHTEEVSEEVNENIQDVVILEHPDSREVQEHEHATVEVVVIPPEEPPTYEAAVIKPPPYDLHYHLTPNASPTLARRQYLPVSKDSYDDNFNRLTPLSSARSSMFSEEENDDSLPSYQDAIIASREDINSRSLENISISD